MNVILCLSQTSCRVHENGRRRVGCVIDTSLRLHSFLKMKMCQLMLALQMMANAKIKQSPLYTISVIAAISLQTPSCFSMILNSIF